MGGLVLFFFQRRSVRVRDSGVVIVWRDAHTLRGKNPVGSRFLLLFRLLGLLLCLTTTICCRLCTVCVRGLRMERGREDF